MRVWVQHPAILGGPQNGIYRRHIGYKLKIMPKNANVDFRCEREKRRWWDSERQWGAWTNEGMPVKSLELSDVGNNNIPRWRLNEQQDFRLQTLCWWCGAQALPLWPYAPMSLHYVSPLTPRKTGRCAECAVEHNEHNEHTHHTHTCTGC